MEDGIDIDSIDIDNVGVPGDRTSYYLAAQVQRLPSSARSMYAIYEVGDEMCVYREGGWWCSPTEVVRAVLGL